MNNIGQSSLNIGYIDTLAAGTSPLHRLDARAKLITAFMFIVAVVSFNKYALSAMLPFLAYPVVLISVSGLPAGYFIKRVLVLLPFAVLVAIFNPLMDRGTLFYLGTTGISGGWVSFLSILFRFVLTVSAAFILVAVTGFNEVCESLMAFGVPKPFVVQLLFLRRYLFNLSDEAERMVRAQSFRSFRKGAIRYQVFTSLIGHLLLRAFDRAERIYRAMRSRGFDGHIRMFRTMKIGYQEIIFVCGWGALFLFFRCWNIPLQLGKLTTGY
jgi:cobalt/nickel transport system permease protein